MTKGRRGTVAGSSREGEGTDHSPGREWGWGGGGTGRGLPEDGKGGHSVSGESLREKEKVTAAGGKKKELDARLGPKLIQLATREVRYTGVNILLSSL